MTLLLVLVPVVVVAGGLFFLSRKPAIKKMPIPYVVPPATVRTFGVQIHPFIVEADLDLVVKTKATFCRCDIGMDIALPQLDMIYNGLLARNITPIFITSIVGGPNPTGTDYVSYHTQLATRYPKAWWEICNEVNIEFFWHHPDPTAYASLVQSIVPPMRKVLDPSSKIISAGTSGIPIDFMRTYLDAGVSSLVDYVGFHPYGQTPETLPGHLNELRNITSKPLFATEYGVPGGDGRALTEMATACGNLGVPFIWYQIKDESPNPLDANNTFGIFTADGAPKPSMLQAAISYATSVAHE